MKQKTDIQNYIPQRPPMLMIDKIISCNEQEVLTEFVVKVGTIFVENGYLQEAGIIENMAQSAAAMTGVLAKQQGQEVKRGFIGAVKKLKIEKLPKSSANLSTSVKVIAQVMNANVIEAKVTESGGVIASCQMNIFLEE